MANLYCSVVGGTPRMVTKQANEMLSVHVRGREYGVRVIAEMENGFPVFRVYATEGSSGRNVEALLGTYKRELS